MLLVLLCHLIGNCSHRLLVWLIYSLVDLSYVSLALALNHLLKLKYLVSKRLQGNFVRVTILGFHFVYQIRDTVVWILSFSQRMSVTVLAYSVDFRAIFTRVAYMFLLALKSLSAPEYARLSINKTNFSMRQHVIYFHGWFVAIKAWTFDKRCFVEIPIRLADSFGRFKLIRAVANGTLSILLERVFETESA